MSKEIRDGARIYNKYVLGFYDAWVLGFSNSYVWKCNTRTVLLPFFESNLSTCHLEVGVGTGFYLMNMELPKQQSITLFDLNPNTLAMAKARLLSGDPERSVECVCDDVVKPMGLLGQRKFESISMYYLLHCLPGTMLDKAKVFEYLKGHLTEDGVLFGATILGSRYAHNWLGRKLIEKYNAMGVFGNVFDTVDDLQCSLLMCFEEVSVTQVGVVALFSARAPRVS